MRSYFVLKLPFDWGLDIQLGKDVDNQQFTFFDDHSDTITENTKIILCIAEPEYVYGEKKPGSLSFTLDRMTGLVKHKGAKVVLQLAGDVHNYQRYEIPIVMKQEKNYIRHHIVSGGGGAFLHPTHSFPVGDDKHPENDPVKVYPKKEDSQELAKGLRCFAFKHKGMSALIGGLYVAFFWQTGLQFEVKSYSLLQNILLFPVQHLESFILMLIVILGCMAFAGFGDLKKISWGGLHGVVHIVMAVISWCLGRMIVESIVSNDNVVLGVYLSRIITFLIGGFLGGTLFGLYLLVSLNKLGIHRTEAFSALSCPDYKNFLRCNINAEGVLEISVTGIDKSASDNQQHPVKTHLIERITIS